jgi:CheY-like chemotaxis protein
MEAVGQLAGGVAHDFNNLLQAALVNIERAELMVPHGDGRLREALDSASTTLTQGAELVRQLLSVSRRQPLRAEPLQMGQAVAGMLELLQRAAGDAVSVVTDGPAEPWHSLIDPAQFQAAILNLVINARDAMPFGGLLRIETLNLELGEAQGRALDLPPGEYCGLIVTDSGVGMTAEVLARVFEPFFTTKDIGQGSGLGLPQVHSFVRRSGGGIAIESEPGQGTTVRICLPRHAAPADAPAGTARARARAGGLALPAATILLVEDDPRVLEQMRLGLEEVGLRIVAAADGSTAIAMLAARPDIELLLTDVVLAGGISGVELAREARRRRPWLPVLLVSGHAADVLDTHKARDEFDLLPKPYRRAELVARLRDLLPEREGAGK